MKRDGEKSFYDVNVYQIVMLSTLNILNFIH